MPRAPRQIFPGGLHHAGHHVNAGRRLFADDRDRLRWIHLLRETADDHDLRVLAWCLMDTHYHLLVEDPQARLSAAMQQLNAALARCRNAKDGAVGSLLRNRFFARPVRTERHLLATARYIPNNPVAAGMVGRPEQWRWSSHCATAEGRPDPVADIERLLEWFEGSPAQYAAFVSCPDPANDLLPPWRLPTAVLSETRPPLTDLLQASDARLGAARARRWGYPLREIAAALGVGMSTVGRWTDGWQEVPDPVCHAADCGP